MPMNRVIEFDFGIAVPSAGGRNDRSGRRSGIALISHIHELGGV
jgi:hypothetical protein